MKYFSVSIKNLKLSKEDRKELEQKLSSLDRTILSKAKMGSDIVALLSCGKPYINKFGSKEFASTPRILGEVSKLQKLHLLERR